VVGQWSAASSYDRSRNLLHVIPDKETPYEDAASTAA